MVTRANEKFTRSRKDGKINFGQFVKLLRTADRLYPIEETLEYFVNLATIDLNSHLEMKLTVGQTPLAYWNPNLHEILTNASIENDCIDESDQLSCRTDSLSWQRLLRRTLYTWHINERDDRGDLEYLEERVSELREKLAVANTPTAAAEKLSDELRITWTGRITAKQRNNEEWRTKEVDRIHSELKAAEGAHEREQLQDELDIITVAIKESELFERLDKHDTQWLEARRDELFDRLKEIYSYEGETWSYGTKYIWTAWKDYTKDLSSMVDDSKDFVYESRTRGWIGPRAIADFSLVRAALRRAEVRADLRTNERTNTNSDPRCQRAHAALAERFREELSILEKNPETDFLRVEYGSVLHLLERRAAEDGRVTCTGCGEKKKKRHLMMRSSGRSRKHGAV
jgi:hypothetical protein